MQNIVRNLERIRAELRILERSYGRAPGSVSLLAVSKGHGPEAVRMAAGGGQREFGESYVQEAVAKMAQLADLPILWHFIGPIQSNKTRIIAKHFAWVHSVDREKAARRLAEARPAASGPMNVCVQVNISAEATKSGAAPEDVPGLARSIAQLPGLRLRGVMALPAPSGDIGVQRAAFRRVMDIYAGLRREGLAVDTLSIGTTSDREAAIAEGATIVRIGAGIFGAPD